MSDRRAGAARRVPPADRHRHRRGLIAGAAVVAFVSLWAAGGCAPATQQTIADVALYASAGRSVEEQSSIEGRIELTAAGCVGLLQGESTVLVVWPAGTQLLSEHRISVPGSGEHRIDEPIELDGTMRGEDSDLGLLGYGCGASEVFVVASR